MPDGLSLDLMRRDRSSDNGLNEFMISSLMAACPDLGVRRVSLNFAVFRDAIERGERIGAGPVLRVWRSLLIFASRWWQIESLYRFNVKFRPYWEPRFISFPVGARPAAHRGRRPRGRGVHRPSRAGCSAGSAAGDHRPVWVDRCHG